MMVRFYGLISDQRLVGFPTLPALAIRRRKRSSMKSKALEAPTTWFFKATSSPRLRFHTFKVALLCGTGQFLSSIMAPF